MTPEEAEALIPLAAELIGSACAGHPEPLWDATIVGESERQRVARQTRALAICRGCPVRLACAASVDLKHDDGIRGGMVLPTIYDRDRRAASSFQPGRGGMALLLMGIGRETSGCSRETSHKRDPGRAVRGPLMRQHERAADPEGTTTNPGASVMLSPSTAEPRKWSANPLTPAEVVPYEAKFWKHVTPGAPDECWEWTGARLKGYGQVHIGYGKDGTSKMRAHRVSWVLHTGRELPADISIDHLCSNPPCVNPHHLEPVSIYENRRRAKGKMGSPEGVERQVQSFLLIAEVDHHRHPRGQIRRICPICGQSYGTDYLADHIRRHVAAGPDYRPRRVPPRDGTDWDRLLCPDCGKRLTGHIRLHRQRKHGAA